MDVIKRYCKAKRAEADAKAKVADAEYQLNRFIHQIPPKVLDAMLKEKVLVKIQTEAGIKVDFEGTLDKDEDSYFVAQGQSYINFNAKNVAGFAPEFGRLAIHLTTD